MKIILKAFLVCLAALLVLCGCGKAEMPSSSSGAASSTVAVNDKVTLDGMSTDAANEIISTLEKIRTGMKDTSAVGSAAAVRSATLVMGLAVGNSLSQQQTETVVKYWKQNHTAEEFSELYKDYGTAYEEYKILSGDGFAAELKKTDLSASSYDYCGNGSLDMVEWLYSAIVAVSGETNVG